MELIVNGGVNKKLEILIQYGKCYADACIRVLYEHRKEPCNLAEEGRGLEKKEVVIKLCF